MIEVWGMTETGRVFWNAHEPRAVETRAFGRPTATLQARVVDEQDQDVADGVAGELVVRHTAAQPRHGFFSGYLKKRTATEEAWRGGWFHTGDVVTRDASGMLYFVDRKKNIIRRSGENIAAAEIEAVLQAHEEVAQVAVIAVPDEVREEEVFACVVPMPGVVPSPALADGDLRLGQRAARLLQAAGLDPVSRHAADHGHAKSSEDADLSGRRGSARSGRGVRSARAEKAGVALFWSCFFRENRCTLFLEARQRKTPGIAAGRSQ